MAKCCEPQNVIPRGARHTTPTIVKYEFFRLICGRLIYLGLCPENMIVSTRVHLKLNVDRTVVLISEAQPPTHVVGANGAQLRGVDVKTWLVCMLDKFGSKHSSKDTE